jgi:hypothetical protein
MHGHRENRRLPPFNARFYILRTSFTREFEEFHDFVVRY